MNIEPLDRIPLWGFFLLAICLSLLAVEIGYRFGIWRYVRGSKEQETPVAAMVASILGLLAFMLAFTFGLAASRFDARRQAVLEEANSIGTTYLRTELLPEPQRSAIRKLLRDYTELRVQKMNADSIEKLITQSNALHAQIWSQAMEAADKDRHSIMTGLFLQSLNDTIDLHSKRIFVGLLSRVPVTIWIALWSLTLIGMISVGYQAGLAGTRRSPEMPVLTLAFAVVLLLVVDLDRAHEGFLRINQQSMIDLLKSMQMGTP